MEQAIATILSLYIMLWASFQPILNSNTAMTQESIKIALYEVQKEASLEGRFTESMYNKFKSELSENHGYDPDCITIKGTENRVERGQDIQVQVSVPKPMQSFTDVFDFASCDRPDSYDPYSVSQSIRSEYIP